MDQMISEGINGTYLFLAMMREMSKIKHFANTWFNTLGNETKTIFGKVSMIFPIAIIRV